MPNPKLLTEDFAARLTEDQYKNLRAKIHTNRNWIDEAFDAETRNDSIIAWRRVFGDDFAKGEDVKASVKGITESVLSKSLVLASAAHRESLVDEVLSYGLIALPLAFYQPFYQKQPPWRRLPVLSGDVQVTATYHTSRGAPGRNVVRGRPLPRTGGLWFTAHMNGYAPVPDGHRVQWRITNTGSEAIVRHAGRGGFYDCTRTHMRWEDLQYRGVHLAEAFIIRMSDDVLVGQSPPFEVVIR